MALQLVWSPRALNQLHELYLYIANDSPNYAALFVQRLIQFIEGTVDFPMSGRGVPELPDMELREKVFQGYRIVYRTNESALEIVAICHGSRTLTNALDDKS